MRRRSPSAVSRGISNLTVRDALTGVYAKAALQERLEEEVHRAQRYGEAFSVLLLDLNHFKSVNDAFGHARGDATLTEFVRRVQQTARNSDVLFRYGGDEFVLFLPRTSHEQACMLADRLAASVAGAPFSGQPPLTLSVAIGVATIPEDGTTAADVLARADARMYEGKRGAFERPLTTAAVQRAEVLLDEGTRLIERLDALVAANRFFDQLPICAAGLLRVGGVPGCGRTRMLAEMQQLAGLRGLRVIALSGSAYGNIEPFSAIRRGCAEAAQLSSPPTDPNAFAATLRAELLCADVRVTLFAIDDIDTVDAESLDVVSVLLRTADAARPVGVIYGGSHFDLGSDSQGVSEETVTLFPLTREGVRAWLRSVFRWEPPPEFVEWAHDQTGGVPKAVRRLVLHLVERKLLIGEDGAWQLVNDFREIAGYRLGIRRPGTHGLRMPVTALIGRDEEFRQLLRLVSSTRLMTLVGPAGAGKTRLAMELASEAAERFEHGVAFVTIASRMSVIELASAIANTLNIESLPGPDPWVGLARQLRHKKLLMILDGTDGISGVDEALSTLTDLATDVHVLAIARRRLKTDGWAFHLGGLRVPEAGAGEDREPAGSVRLFYERAAGADGQVNLAGSERGSVQRICQLLDGNALSIELTAALTATRSCREIAEELDAVLAGIIAYMPGIPRDEQRSRAALDQSWHALSEAERAVLRRASVFAAEFDGAAAICITNATEYELDRLVELGALARCGVNRYALHPLIRDYARTKLDAFALERAESNSLFAEYYLGMAQELAARLNDVQTMRDGLADFTRDLANIRRAWMIALVEERLDLVELGASAWFDFFEARCYAADAEALFASAVRWLESARVDETNGAGPVAQLLRARHGATLLSIGRLDDARYRLSQALTAAQALGSAPEQAFCMRHLALVEQATGHSGSAEEYARGAVVLARTTSNADVLVSALRDAALVAVRRGALQSAVEYLLEAISVEGQSSAKTAVWRLLLQAVEPIVTQGMVPLPTTVLLQIINDRDADAEIVARARRVLESLSALRTPSA